MNVFEFSSYKSFLNQSLKPKSGAKRGQLSRFAAHLRIHGSTLSQILSGEKNLTLEQSCLAAEYLGLRENEVDFFLPLVLFERADTPKVRSALNRQVKHLQAQAENLVKILPHDQNLNFQQQSQYYSNWAYSALHALSSIPGFQNVDAMAEYFHLPRAYTASLTQALLEFGVCRNDQGIIEPGKNYMHLEADSPLISKHHSNWRLKAMEKHPMLSRRELAYTCPMSLSASDADKVKQLLIALILETNAIRDPSPCEELYCLNVDWFSF